MKNEEEKAEEIVMEGEGKRGRDEACKACAYEELFPW